MNPTKEDQVPQELIDWLDDLRTLAQGGYITSANTQKACFVTGYRADSTSKQWRALDASHAEEMVEQLRNTGNWTRIEINGVERFSKGD